MAATSGRESSHSISSSLFAIKLASYVAIKLASYVASLIACWLRGPPEFTSKEFRREIPLADMPHAQTIEMNQGPVKVLVP